MGTMGKLLKGYLLAILLFVLLTAASALLLRFTALPESAGWICALLSLTAACLFIGIFTGNLSGKRGLLYGLLAAALLIAGLLFLVLLFFSTPFSWETLSWQHTVPLFCGAVGGILGTNMK